MQVDEVMSHRVTVVEADATLSEAAERMRAAVVGALPVVSCGRLVGMVTDRDLVVRGLARNLDGATHVREVMTHNPVTCLGRESADAAAALMRRHEIRRLVVIDESLLPVGVLSVDDLALYPETGALAIQVLSRLPEARGLELDGSLESPDAVP